MLSCQSSQEHWICPLPYTKSNFHVGALCCCVPLCHCQICNYGDGASNATVGWRLMTSDEYGNSVSKSQCETAELDRCQEGSCASCDLTQSFWTFTFTFFEEFLIVLSTICPKRCCVFSGVFTEATSVRRQHVDMCREGFEEHILNEDRNPSKRACFRVFTIYRRNSEDLSF